MPRYRRDDRAMPLYISIRQHAVSLPQRKFLVGLCLQTVVNYLSTRSPNVSVSVNRDLKLFGGKIIYEVFQPIYSCTVPNVTDGQTDGRYTVASPRGKNRKTKYRKYYRYRRYFKLKIPVYCRFKKPTWTITRPIHTPTGPMHVRCKLHETLWNVSQNEDEHRVYRLCGYKIWRANYSHLSPKNYTKWQLCSLVYKQSDVSHLRYTVSNTIWAQV